MWCRGFSLFLLIGIYFHQLTNEFVSGYAQYALEIPNGEMVSHPCLTNYLWKGVGHIKEPGGGDRNGFGKDFAQAGRTWTKALCQKDSDGDGKTNGQELGDPNCEWSKGKVPKNTLGITHPGICEPWDSDLCKSTNTQIYGANLCQVPKFNCPAANTSDVIIQDYRFAPTAVPAQETTYYCQAFEMPNDNKSYHFVAMEPIINNSYVMHHLLMFGCNAKPSDASLFTKASSCMMANGDCQAIIAIWGVGSYGDCFYKDLGITVGTGGYQYVILQFHWNNPQKISTYTDSSGIRMYLTPTKRKYEGGIMIVGQRYLELPAGQMTVNQSMSCSSTCTKRLIPTSSIGKINITFSTHHMHYNGRYGSIEQWRDGKKIYDILPYGEVRYDNPPMLTHDPPLEVYPGDELKVLCTYRTMGNGFTVYYGDGTLDEMCFAFFTYYPKIQMDGCIYYADQDLCLNMLETNYSGCQWSSFYQYWNSLKGDLTSYCSPEVNTCRGMCKPVVKKLLEHPCMKGKPKIFYDFISSYNADLKELRLQIYNCETVLSAESLVASTPSPQTVSTSGMSSSSQLALIIAGSVAAFALLLVVAIFGIVKAFMFPTTIKPV